jgi:hypothetical protein
MLSCSQLHEAFRVVIALRLFLTHPKPAIPNKLPLIEDRRIANLLLIEPPRQEF